MIPQYVFDTGALILIPLPVIAEWRRGRTGAREEILAAGRVVASLGAAQAAGVALGKMKDADATLTIDAIVMATAALAGAIVVTSDPDDFERLAPHFPKVAVLPT